MPNQLASPKKNVTIAPHLQERLREVLDEIVSAHVRREIGTTAGIEGLTGRQREIVDMVRQGASNKIIARDLGLSVGTVKVHMHRIFRALQINNRVQLALLPSHSGFDIEPSRAAGRFSEARAGRVA